MRFRWGIIGTGRIAEKFAEALNGCEDAEFYAVGSRSADKAAAFAEKFGAKKSYGSYADLAADSGIDIVYIATPMSSHYADTLLCIENGRNVLCEKSIAVNSVQFGAMCAAAEKKGVFFMEAMWMKCRPTYLKAMEWIRDGRIGNAEFIKADFCNLMPYNSSDRTFDLKCGGGALLDLGVYPLTLAADILGGKPDEVISFAHLANGVDMSNSITLKYSNALAVIQSGFEVQMNNRALVAGDKGSIIYGDWFHCTSEVHLLGKDGREVETSVIPVRVNGYEYEIEEAQHCLSEGLKESPLVPLSLTGDVMEIMDECRKHWGLVYPEEKQ